MKVGFTTSLIAHSAAVFFGVVSLSAPAPMKVADVEALPVEIIPIEDITRTVTGADDAEITEAAAPTPTTRPQTDAEAQNVGDADTDRAADADEVENTPPVEEVKEASAEPEPAEAEPTPEPPTPEPEPESEPEQVAALPQETEPTPAETELAPSQEAAPEEESFPTPKTITRPKARPVRKAEKKKTENDKIAVLLNKEKASAGGAKRSDKKAGRGTKKGNNAVKLSASEIDALRSQIQSCFNPGALPGGPDAETLRARVEMRLLPDGSIDGRPSAKASGGSSRSTRAMAGAARRAVQRCAPYKLPQEKYENWADVVVNFSLNDML